MDEQSTLSPQGAADRPAIRELFDYLDTFEKIDQGWYFAERNLILDWSETRSPA